MGRAAFAIVLGTALTVSAAETQTFGKPLQGVAKVSLAEVLAKPEAGKRVRLEGRVDKVCQNKGCWLELKEGASAIHVTFEGYSFFVPKDSMGKPCILEGVVKVKEPSPEEIEHKKSEGGASAVGQRVSVEATGVEIR